MIWGIYLLRANSNTEKCSSDNAVNSSIRCRVNTSIWNVKLQFSMKKKLFALQKLINNKKHQKTLNNLGLLKKSSAIYNSECI